MGKYYALNRYLNEIKDERNTTRFSKVEEILGFPLPASAKRYRPWWANDKTHVQAIDGWLAAGWKVKFVDLQRETVTFQRIATNNSSKDSLVKRNNYSTKVVEDFTPFSFEEFARRRMILFFKNELRPRRKEKWPKLFDMVSDDYQIVGDAKYLSMVRGKYIPPAKFSVIAEHIWMLEKINTKTRFLVFGNDRKVPEEWLKRYGEFTTLVKFYFLTKSGDIIPLN